MTEATTHPLSGLWQPTHLHRLHYGPNTVHTHLLSTLPTPTSKAFIITTSSLATRTPLVRNLESLLTPSHHAGTFSNIKQHAPVSDLDAATAAVAQDPDIDTLISLGGGSPIDSAKAISFRHHEKSAKYLYHIAIPTTLSAAECTFNAGCTSPEGKKIGVAHPECAPKVIFYDALYAKHTPLDLWLSTGIRALDHAVEMLYNSAATEVPAKMMALGAIEGLFSHLPRCKESGMGEDADLDVITNCQLAAFASLYPMGLNKIGGLGLSHAIGYALGSPYGIPHGITSCISLAGVVRYKAEDGKCAEQIARAVVAVGGARTGNNRRDALAVADRIEALVRGLGLEKRLGDYGVGRDQVGVVARMAMGRQDGEAFERVMGIVEAKL